MLANFLNFIEKHSLIRKNDKLLLSLSGGADSVSLFNLLIEAQIPFDAAHCNYHLRGEESNRDETFVTELCKKHNINLIVKHFNTEEFAAKNNISIEMAARDLRYEWYKELVEEHSYTKIATAHHLNDQAETFFINIIRNTGLNGICGIPLVRQLDKNAENTKLAECYIIRPLLFATQAEIMQYIAVDDYVIDSTNETDNYLRNKLRHNIIPEFEKISEGFTSNLQNSIDKFKYSRSFINKVIADFFPQQTNSENQYKIIIPKDFSFEELAGYFYFALYDFGFNFKQIDDIASSAKNVGKKFFSKNYELVVDRDFLIVRKREENNSLDLESEKSFVKHYDNAIVIFFENEAAFQLAEKMKVSIIPRKELSTIPNNPSIACLDYHKIEFPLFITSKREGDFFYPLGMGKKKKLSDFFIDNKLDQFAKNATFALRSSNNDILWLIRHRIDDRYKIDNETSVVLMMEII